MSGEIFKAKNVYVSIFYLFLKKYSYGVCVVCCRWLFFYF